MLVRHAPGAGSPGVTLLAVIGLQERHDVRLGYASVLAGAGDHRRVEIVFFEQSTNGRAGLDRSRVQALLFCRLFFLAAGALPWPCRSTSHHLRQNGQYIASHNGRSIFNFDLLQNAASRRGNLEHDLVGFEIDEIFVTRYGITRFLMPGDQRCVADRFGQVRDFDFNCHFLLRPASLGFADLLALLSISERCLKQCLLLL